MEFFNEYTNLSFPAGILQDLLTDRIRPGSQTNQTASFCYSRAVDMSATGTVINVIFRIEEDYIYHLKNIRVSFPKLAQGADAPELRVKIIQGERGRNITPEPLAVPMRLISTPGQEQILRAAQKLNLTYYAGSTMGFQFTNFDPHEDLYIMTEGLRIPKVEHSFI